MIYRRANRFILLDALNVPASASKKKIMIKTVYIGIGSNLNDPEKNCKQAIDLIHAHPDIAVTARSAFYETEPWGIKDQNWFVNAVIRAETSLPPKELLLVLLTMEIKMGRVRGEKWGPRIIDLDLLLYEDLILEIEGLKIPHPEIQNRNFVLIPLLEIDPERTHPVFKKTPGELLESLTDQQKIRKIQNPAER